MNAIDRLFSEKLERHKTTPSAEAWQRVEAGMTTQANPASWIRWAAILVPASVAAALWFSQPTSTGLAQQPTQPTPAIQQNSEVTTPITEAPVQQQPVARKNVKRKKAVSKPVSVPAPEPELESVALALTPEAIPLEEITIEPAVPVIEPTVTEPDAKPMVIVYTLDPVVTEVDKPSSLQRVVDFARSVKHSDPIGDLRGLKDELLAFDLRKKSTKKN